eukprot:CAMPEP_0204618064 /NCGR_PEP_ID=MMETSP0717-20131115/4837_1 /ASSEMBLY_ACC=CAM_ASM_000666 /TAXON_ID=230516 /ORGANISM="Chaetoceros curvisetus" /LENGTH=135 /DNA_ID=CAMNT_0051631723 /DNA_START=4 /DNA_END=411 /DNA_ORIENTATION=-
MANGRAVQSTSTCSRLLTTSLRQAENDDFEFFGGSNNEDQTAILDELTWRSKKVQLEEAEKERFQKRLKSKPWKLPYDDASQWVQKNLGAQTKEEFFDLVENGNLRTPYIPKSPEEYYTEKGTWISWDHFLDKKA